MNDQAKIEIPVTRYKIVFLGDSNVGKTSIINKFIYDEFQDQY